ncbi:MAG: YdiU family protein [Legionella sp.]|nr:YdiU family protein [Legionella sp.]
MNDQTVGWNFDNSYAKLPEHFYTKVAPTVVAHPQLLILNKELSKQLGLHLTNLSQEQLAQLFSGNVLPKGALPLAQAYAGHQFGYFTMLGDGRAHLLGEHVTPDGQRVDIQLKGSGRTPYGLRGDGRAAIEPMLREYILSEAMDALNIPTTRSLAVVTTGELVRRETMLPGAILTRIASSHVRVGSFEYLSAHNDISGLKMLADYVIARHYPEAKLSKNPYLQLLLLVIKKQITLIVHWMRVGFIHGVMNTDNMSISGETIDYGPCAFMDTYDPNTVFSSIDSQGRYSYINQPKMAQWNLARFAETLLPLLDEDKNIAIELATAAINDFQPLYQSAWLVMMRQKLGLTGDQRGDEDLINEILQWMKQQAVDYTNTFRALSTLEHPNDPVYNCKPFTSWYDRWQSRLKQNEQPHQSSGQLMQTNNPAIIPRNHKVAQALEAASKGNLEPLHALLQVLKTPYTDNPANKDYQSPPSPKERVYQTFCGT